MKIKQIDVLIIRDVKHKEIEQVFKTPILQQTAFWSKVKRRFGMDSIALNIKVKSSALKINDTFNPEYTGSKQVLEGSYIIAWDAGTIH